jgi:hypothetical protein
MITTDDLSKTEEVHVPKKHEKDHVPSTTSVPDLIDNTPVTRAEFESLKKLFQKTEGDVSYIRRRVG